MKRTKYWVSFLVSLIWLFTLRGVGYSQVTDIIVSPSDSRRTSDHDITITHVKNKITAHGLQLVVVGSGAFSLTFHGTNNCFNNRYGNLTGTANGTNTVNLWIKVYVGTNPAIGTTVCNLRLNDGITTYTINVTNVVVPYMPAIFTNYNRVPDNTISNCSASTAEMDYRNLCTLPTWFPNGGFTETPVGQFYTEQTFGTRLKRVTEVGVKGEYASKPALNKDATYLEAQLSVISPAGMYEINTDTIGLGTYSNNRPVFWSTKNPKVWYNGDSTNININKHDFTAGLPPTVTTIYTLPEPNMMINAGGNAGIVDEWFAFWTSEWDGTPPAPPWTGVGPRVYLCAINLANTTNRHCFDLRTLQWGPPNQSTNGPTQGYVAHVTKADAEGYRYVTYSCYWEPGTPGGPPGDHLLLIFSFKENDGTGMTLLTPNGLAVPDSPDSNGSGGKWRLTPEVGDSYLGTGGHSTVAYAGGEVFYVPAGVYRQLPAFGPGNGFMSLTALRKGYSNLAYELQGPYGQIGGDPFPPYMAGALDAGQLVIISNSDPGATLPNAFIIGNITYVGTTATVTTDAIHNILFGDTVMIRDVNGSLTGVIGDWTVGSVPTPTSFTFVNPGGFTGSFTDDNRASCERVATPTGKNTARQREHQVHRYAKYPFGAFTARRVALSMSDAGTGFSCGAYCTQFVFGGLSSNGKVGIYADNQGYMTHISNFVFKTGWDLFDYTKSNHFDRYGKGFEIYPTDTTAVVMLKGLMKGDITISYGTTLTMSSSANVNGTEGLYRSTTLSGLTANTTYYMRVVWDNYDVGVYEFKTLPSRVGTKNVWVKEQGVQGGTNIQVRYGTSLPLAGVIIAGCSGVMECKVNIPSVNQGLLYYQTEILNSGKIVKSSRIVSMAVN